MSDWDSYAFQPGQQVLCKTRFDDEFKGEVVAFDLSSRILILKSPSTSGVATNHDIHILVLDSVSDVQIIAEPGADAVSDQLRNIDTSHITAKKSASLSERMRLIDAVGNGVSREGIELFTALTKKYDRASDLVWKDKVKIVVMNSVVINPPYTEADCQSLSPKTPNKEAVSYLRSNVRKFWESCSKPQQAQQQQQLQQQQSQPQPQQQK